MTWVQYGIAFLVTLTLTPFVLGRVGAFAYGLWLVFVQALGYAGLLDLGITPAVVRYVSEARARKDPLAVQQTVGAALRFHVGAALVCVSAGIFLAAGVGHWLDLGEVPLEQARLVVLVATIATAVGFPAMALTGALRGFQRFDLASALGIAAHLSRAVVTVLALAIGWGLIGLAVASLVGNLVALAGGAFLLRRVAGAGSLAYSGVSRLVLRRMLSFGAFTVIGAVGWHLAYGSDTILIATILTATDAAHFGVAVSVLAMVSTLVGGFAGNLLPLTSLQGAGGQRDRVGRIYLLGTRAAATLAFPQLIVLFMEGPRLLELWLGTEVGRPAGANLRLLVLAYLPCLLNAVSIPVALGLGLHRFGAGLAVSEGVLKVVVSLALVTPLGAKGVAVATLVSGLLHQGVLWPAGLCRHVGLPVRRYVREAWLPPFLPAMALLLALFVWHQFAAERHEVVRWSVLSAAVLLYWRATLGPLRREGRRIAEG